jgi:HEPN domain-containing protein
MPNNFLLPYEIFITKAKQDLTLVEKNIDDNEVAPEIIFFHLQQAVEKALKALLDFSKVTFKKTHDLYELAEMAKENGIAVPDFVDKLCELTPYAVEARYALMHDDLEDARVFLENTQAFIDFVEKLLVDNQR